MNYFLLFWSNALKTIYTIFYPLLFCWHNYYVNYILFFLFSFVMVFMTLCLHKEHITIALFYILTYVVSILLWLPSGLKLLENSSMLISVVVGELIFTAVVVLWYTNMHVIYPYYNNNQCKCFTYFVMTAIL